MKMEAVGGGSAGVGPPACAAGRSESGRDGAPAPRLPAVEGQAETADRTGPEWMCQLSTPESCSLLC